MRKIRGESPEGKLRATRCDKLLKRDEVIQPQMVAEKQGLGLEAEPFSMLDETRLAGQTGSGGFRIERFNRWAGLALASPNRHEPAVQFAE